MKKNLFILALCAISTCFFAGCKGPEKGKDEPGTDIKIEITPATLTLSVGESQKLNYKVTPVGTSVSVKWASNDASVVTVNQSGIIQAVAAGTATITASADNATSGTCVVTVSNDAVLNNFSFSDFSIFGEITEVAGAPIQEVELKSGVTVKCKVVTGLYLYVWNSGLTFVNGTGFAGEGYIIMPTTPLMMYQTAESVTLPSGETLKEGKLIGTDYWAIEAMGENQKLYTTEAGYLADTAAYCTFWDKYVDYVTERDTTTDLEPLISAYQDAHKGAILWSWNANKNATPLIINVYGYVKHAQFASADEGAEEAILYTATIEWLDFVNEGRLMGLKTEGSDAALTIVHPYDMNTITKTYSNESGEVAEAVAAPKYVVIDEKHIHLGENPLRQVLESKSLYNLYRK